MGRKRAILVVLTAFALFGAAISGCNNNRDRRLASAENGRGRNRFRRAPAEGPGVRPAEVLAASARRPRTPVPAARAQRRPQPQRGQIVASSMGRNRQPLARYEPLPEPVPIDRMHMARQPQAYQLQYGPAYASAGTPPVYNQTSVPQPRREYAQVDYGAAQSPSISAPYTLQPSQSNPAYLEKVYENDDGWVVHPTPELTVARAQLQGSAPLSDRVEFLGGGGEVPLPTPESFPVPIPELEPVRYNRVPRGGWAAGPSAARW